MFAFATKCGETKIAPTVEYITSTSSSSDLTTYTFSSVSLGDIGQSRKIIVVVYAAAISSPRSVSSVSVAGTSASSVVANNSTGVECSIWIADVPSGTTGNVVVTMTAQFSVCGISVYAARNLTNVTAIDTATDSGTDNVANLNLDATDSGFAVGGIYWSGSRTTSWSGIIENFDSTSIGDSTSASVASDNFTTGGTKIISATGSGSSAHRAAAAYFS